jgi:acyl carrier protein
MVLQLIVYVEEEFGISVPEEDVDPAVFQTLGSLVTFIEELRQHKIA